MPARRIKSLRNNKKGISPRHREHRSKNGQERDYWTRKRNKEIIERRLAWKMEKEEKQYQEQVLDAFRQKKNLVKCFKVGVYLSG